MTNGVAVLIINTAIALLFGATFGVIAASYRSDVAAKGFALSYLVGAVAPISELLAVASGHAMPFSILSYGGLLGGLFLMGASLVRFYGHTPSWPIFIGLFLGGVALRLLVGEGARDWLPYEIAFQAPFAIAVFLCGGVAWRLSRQSALSRWLAVVFGIIGVDFLVKPLGAAMLGSGSTARTYALLSQVLSIVLLTATGLMAMLVVFQAAVTRAERQAETDALTRIPNRRGFVRQAKAAFERVRQTSTPISVVMLDLDHFKGVNDRYGHAMGDAVLIAFAHLIARAVPPRALIGRMGGEEFAIVLEGVDLPGATSVAETIRLGAHSLTIDGATSFTTSGGIVERRADESLKDMLRSADMALYHAKTMGRDRISRFRSDVPDITSGSVTDVPANASAPLLHVSQLDGKGTALSEARE